MTSFTAANFYLTPFLILIFLVIDYARDKSADIIQRCLFFAAAFATQTSILCEYFGLMFDGVPGRGIFILKNILGNIFFLSHFVASYGMVVFIDYTINKNIRRIVRLGMFLGVLYLIHLGLLIFNIRAGFYFSYTLQENRYAMGNLYFIRHFFDFIAILIMVIDLLTSRKKNLSSYIILVLVFSLPLLIKIILDIYLPSRQLLWPSSVVSLFFGYLFIIRNESYLDSLTGLANRRSCQAYFTALARSARSVPHGFILADVDHFKRINDIFGHNQGDEALRDVSGILLESVRHFDYVARYGGDEFLIIMQKPDNLSHTAERIYRNLETFNAKKKRPYELELSIGYDVFRPGGNMTPLDFMNHVDSLMYRNKAERRNGRT